MALAVFFVFGCAQAPAPENGGTPASQNPPAGGTPTYGMQEVEKHSTAQDCWLVIDKRVFDVTDFISSHPGGEAILEGCGKDATELFETRPMGSGTPHSENARNIREQYHIGDLK